MTDADVLVFSKWEKGKQMNVGMTAAKFENELHYNKAQVTTRGGWVSI